MTTPQQARLLAVAEQLEEYTRRYERARDSRAVFTYAYTLETRRIADELPQAYFAEPEWVVLVAEAFAQHYFRALDAFDQNRTVPGAWGKVFDTICRKTSSVLEDLLFSMTAHIVHDLPLTLVEVGLVDDGDRSRIGDFHQINDILGRSVDEIQDAVARRYNPFLRWLDRIGQRNDEILTNFGVRLARGMAWYNAIRLLDPGSKDKARESITRSVGFLINQVRHPPALSLRIFLRFGRLLAGMFRRWPSA